MNFKIFFLVLFFTLILPETARIPALTASKAFGQELKEININEINKKRKPAGQLLNEIKRN